VVVKIGVHQIAFTVPDGPTGIGPELARLAAAVEEAGVSRLSVMDHYFQMEQMFPATDPMLEGYTTLGFLAACSERGSSKISLTGADVSKETISRPRRPEPGARRGDLASSRRPRRRP
jgi:hypothetical protein